VAAIAALAAVLAVAAAAMSGTGGTAATIETAAPTASTIGTSTAIATTVTAATAISAAAAAAERPLESGAGAAANSGRVAWLKFFARRAAGTWGACFAGEKNFVFGRTGCRDLLRLAFELAIVLLVLIVWMLVRVLVGFFMVMKFRFTVLVVLFVRRLVVFESDVIAECGDVQRIFMRGIGFGFRDGLRGVYGFLEFGFVRFAFLGFAFVGFLV
jgi:hypothetical protein